MRKLLGILFFVAQVSLAQTITAPFFFYAPPLPSWGGGDLYNFDFEEANLAAWETATGWDHTGSGGTASISSAQHNTGAQSMLFADGGGYTTFYEEKTLSPNKAELYGTIWVYVTTFPPDGPRSFFHAPNTSGDEYFLCVEQTTHTVTIRGPSEGTILVTSTSSIATNTWTKIQFHMKAAAASSVWEVKMGGNTNTATTSETTASFSSVKIGMDNFSGATTYYIDTFSLDDTKYPL